MADTKINNILDLNDDCLIKIFKYLSLSELCDTAETCKRFQFISREAFKPNRKCYGIPGALQEKSKFKDHERKLKHFGDMVTGFTCIIKSFGFGFGINHKQMKRAFDWMNRYSGDALEKIVIIAGEQIILPEAATTLMAKVKKIELMAPIPEQNLQAALLNCTKLVHLKLIMYDGPFHFPNHRFPHLVSLWNRVRVSPHTDYEQIETFFQHHTALTELSTQFLSDSYSDGVIDLSFLKHLTNLTKLNLLFCNSKIVGIDAFAHLKNLQELHIDGSDDKRTEALIMETLASVDSLVKLELGFPDVSHLIAGIERFKNLTTLAITQDPMGVQKRFYRADIASIAQLHNNHCTELEVSCMTLSEPESIVKVISNLKEVETIKLFCEVALSEAICRKLARVCSSQRRKIEVVLDEDIMAENTNDDFAFIEKFNKEFGTFVEMKVVRRLITDFNK